MSESSTRKVKKKYGKIWEHTVIKRAALIDEDKAEDIAKYLDGIKVVTPQEFANKQGIRVSLARKILANYVDDGVFKLVHKNGSNEIYTK